MLVTDAEVKQIIDTQRDCRPFIETADLIVTEDLSSAGHTAARLKQIELYLAAHFVAIAEEQGGVIRTGAGESSDAFSDVYSSGFHSTRYGQQAIALENTGVLAAIGMSTLKAELRVVEDASH